MEVNQASGKWVFWTHGSAQQTATKDRLYQAAGFSRQGDSPLVIGGLSLVADTVEGFSLEPANSTQ